MYTFHSSSHVYLAQDSRKEELFASSVVVVDFDFVIKPLPRLWVQYGTVGGLNYKLPFLILAICRTSLTSSLFCCDAMCISWGFLAGVGSSC